MTQDITYKELTRGDYAASHRRSGTLLGAVQFFPHEGWRATTPDRKLRATFRNRNDGGRWLLQIARQNNHGCDPGCTCAEG